MSIADKIKFERNKKGISQTSLGELVSVSQQAVGKWEKGLAEPDSDTLKLLADYFEVSIDYLLDYKSETTTPTVQIPEKYGDVFVALNDGNENLEQSDIDDIVRFIEFKKSTKK